MAEPAIHVDVVTEHDDRIAGQADGQGQRAEQRQRARRAGLGLLKDRLDSQTGLVDGAAVRARLAPRPRDRVADLVGYLLPPRRVGECTATLQRGEAGSDRIDSSSRSGHHVALAHEPGEIVRRGLLGSLLGRDVRPFSGQRITAGRVTTLGDLEPDVRTNSDNLSNPVILNKLRVARYIDQNIRPKAAGGKLADRIVDRERRQCRSRQDMDRRAIEEGSRQRCAGAVQLRGADGTHAERQTRRGDGRDSDVQPERHGHRH